MAKWEQEASRRWKSAWVGGSGPFACVVVYGKKATSIMLFKKASDADAHKRRLDSIQSDKKRWKSTEIVSLKNLRTERTEISTKGQR
jgi:hypothetical protein